MFRYFIMAVGLCISLIACSTPAVSVRWDYGTGSNIDEIWTTNVEFYRGGTFIGGYPGGGEDQAPVQNGSEKNNITGREVVAYR